MKQSTNDEDVIVLLDNKGIFKVMVKDRKNYFTFITVFGVFFKQNPNVLEDILQIMQNKKIMDDLKFNSFDNEEDLKEYQKNKNTADNMLKRVLNDKN